MHGRRQARCRARRFTIALVVLVSTECPRMALNRVSCDTGLIAAPPAKPPHRYACVREAGVRARRVQSLFADMGAPTDDDVSINTDGRRLDSVEAMMAFVEDLARERAAAADRVG